MSPFTTIGLGMNAQNNIGLDRQNFNGMFSYRWKPSTIRSNQLDLINLQYIAQFECQQLLQCIQIFVYPFEWNCPGSGLYFSKWRQHAGGSRWNQCFYWSLFRPRKWIKHHFSIDQNDFIVQRNNRLTENNLIFASNFTWIRDSRENINDNSFSRLQFKAELAGNLLSGIASAANLEKTMTAITSCLAWFFAICQIWKPITYGTGNWEGIPFLPLEPLVVLPYPMEIAVLYHSPEVILQVAPMTIGAGALMTLALEAVGASSISMRPISNSLSTGNTDLRFLEVSKEPFLQI